ncbi:hypothetical protein K502DRAFT_324904 [Neoconidiobolus thromboides FSU 785]|nr:hypothetical protein K502DRAFT_324904 [Neoconidiobolus thromboides FSU 785]
MPGYEETPSHYGSNNPHSEKKELINYTVKKSGCVMRNVTISDDKKSITYISNVFILTADLLNEHGEPDLKISRSNFILWYSIWDITYLKRENKVYDDIKMVKKRFQIIPSYTIRMHKNNGEISEYEWYPTSFFCCCWALYKKNMYDDKILQYNNRLFKDSELFQYRYIDPDDLRIFLLTISFLTIHYERPNHQSSVIFY